MAAQAAMIDDTITALKRALARKDPESYPDDPIAQPTNRGNKLRANAKYVHEGALGSMNGRDFYRKKAEHAGYTREILEYNPPRYDSEGDELDFDDSDAAADADAAELNPYAEILLQDILCPLKHPSELPEHPSMRYPYTAKTLTRMVGSIEQRLRRERLALAQAKTLHKQLLGDAAWIPCGLVETGDEEDIFACPPDQLRGYDASVHTLLQLPAEGTGSPVIRSGEDGRDISTDNDLPVAQSQERQGERIPVLNAEMLDARPTADGSGVPERGRSASIPSINNTGARSQGDKSVQASSDAMDIDMTTHGENSNAKDDTVEPPDHSGDGDSDQMTGVQKEGSGDSKDVHDPDEDGNKAMEDGSPERTRRMTTRAQASQAPGSQQQDQTQPSTPSMSGTLHSASDLDITMEPHPLFLLPTALHIDRNCGMPPHEADETRHLLWAYIQKQEVTVRLFAEMLGFLLRSHRMKDDVWEWCKSEGHLGEMSDGEDWYDREKWNLAEGEFLKKGADEDDVEVDEGRATGKRGRARRN